MRRIILRSIAVLFLISFGLWTNNSSWLSGPPHGNSVSLLAHRGVHQTYSREGLTSETCTAARIRQPTHAFLENTLPSMEAAFDYGADVVELDIHPTTDGKFAVFHDWTVDCRTEGHGVTREHSLESLKALDIAYGYTADGGKSFPFRGRGIGIMPSLEEVLTRFPDKRFLINIKSNDPKEGELLAQRLRALPPERLAMLAAYGGAHPIETLERALPALTTMSRPTLKRCLFRYMAVGWSGYVPEACRNTVILLPINIAPWIWGFPHLLVKRLNTAGTSLYIAGPHSGGNYATGVDNKELFERLPDDYRGGIWTNRIELIGPIAQRNER